MVMGVLYRLDFEGGRSYIGVSFKSAEARLTEHKKSARSGKGCKLVSRAWAKYGEPTLIVLAIVEDKDLFDTEKRAIIVYGTRSPNGYNQTDGGEGVIGYIYTDEDRAKIGAASKGRNPWNGGKVGVQSSTRKGMPRTDEVKAKISAKLKGISLSEERKAAISKSLMGNQHTLGRKQTNEQIAKRTAKLKGKIRTDEQKANYSKGQLGNTKAIGYKWYNDGIITIRSKEGCPEGFLPGRLKKQT
jgi:hypothetical protein